MRLALLILCAFVCDRIALAGDQVRLLPRQMHITAAIVEGSGSWVVNQQNVEQPLPLPLINAADFKCHKRTSSCTEAVAALFTSRDDPRMRGQNLHSLLSEYDVTSWTSKQIIAIARYPVADVTLEIDLVNKTAVRRHQETKARGNQTANPRFIVEWALR